jgi:hypothetical protein
MSFIPVKISSKVALAGLKVQQKSPALLLGGGIAGVVGTVILASRATLKLGDVLDKAQADIDLLDKAGELRPDEYSDKDIVKHKAVVKLQLALSIAKLYGPSVALGGVSIALLVSSHNILNKRNAALTTRATVHIVRASLRSSVRIRIASLFTR